jgi:hypothetical protein
MAQTLLPFNYQSEKKEKNLTGLAGLLLYLELFMALKLKQTIAKHLTVRKNKQGYSDDQIVMVLILLNLAGGESVSDIIQLARDEGFCQILKSMELKGAIGRRREKIRKKWNKILKGKDKGKNTIAFPSSIFRYLAYFHNAEEEKKRIEGKAFIPQSNEHLSGFPYINYELINFAQKMNPQKQATLDTDATIVETFKKEALFCYKGPRSYQPFNVWWFEHELLFYTEFRDGNVPAGFEQLRILKECLDHLPPEVEEVYIRSDSAGYQYELLRYCAEGRNKRFGKINFAICNDITPEFKKAVDWDKEKKWKPIYKELCNGRKVESGQEWAEICYVPSELCKSKKSPDYRFIAIREELKQEIFPEMKAQLELPFPTMEMSRKRYKLTGLVTNLDWDGEKIIHWNRQRCGKSEEIHSVMKEDLAGGRFPSGDFGENAAWWWIMILSLNIQSIMKHFVLGGNWKKKRMKLIRFRIINIPGRICSYRDGLFEVRISHNHPSFGLLNRAREKIRELACLPSG